jgi:hypothetical protein
MLRPLHPVVRVLRHARMSELRQVDDPWRMSAVRYSLEEGLAAMT